MRFSAKLAGVVLGLVGASLLVAPTGAHAGPAAVGVDEVIGALGLASEPADYVLLVDTSGSMNQGGRYAAVRQELRKLLDSLGPGDRVSLLTFSASAQPRIREVVGSDPKAVMAKLPLTATGDHTDIGAAIAAGLTELERADTHRSAALILMTDGQLDTLPTSRYANVASTAWKKLKTRATKLAKTHDVAAYAVSLKTTTDAGLLKKVFPSAREVGATEVGAQFAAVGDDLARLQAAKALKDELAAPIRVNWAGDLGAALADGEAVPLQLEITSPYPHVPVVLSNLRVESPDGLEVVVTGLPATVRLDPGQKATISVAATVTGSSATNAAVTLSAIVTSPWRKVLEKDLGLKFAPVLEGAAPVTPTPALVKLPPTLLPTAGGIAGLGALAGLVWFVGRLVTTPQLRGLLAFSRDGRVIGDVVMRGRRMKLQQPAGATELAGLTGVLAGARGPTRGQRAVRVTARLGVERAREVVADGDVIQMGDLQIAYISDRRRILEKIGVPHRDLATK